LPKRRISVWWKLILLVILLGFGGIGGYKLFEKGRDVGCFLLEDDVVPVEITPFRSDHLRLIALGDTGTGNEDQRKVAEGMAKICEQSGCDLVLLLGDNFYPDGVNSTVDPQFKSKFELVYQKLNLPFFAVLGNHDVRQNALSQLIYSLKSVMSSGSMDLDQFSAAKVELLGRNLLKTSLGSGSPNLKMWIDVQHI